MSSDIRIDLGFFDHRKTKKLIARLGLQGVWSLQKLWKKAAENRPRGVLYDMDEEDIALDAEWPGDPKEFCAALSDIRWLDMNEGGNYELHDWEEHQPFIFHSEERSAQAAEAAKIRWEKKAHAKGKRTACAPLTDSNAPSPNPNPSPFPNPYPYPIPSPIKVEVWTGFVEMRKKKKNPLTNHGAELILKDALKIAEEYGQDPNDIIDQSTKRGWAGVFEIKGDSGARGSPTETPIGASEELARRWMP